MRKVLFQTAWATIGAGIALPVCAVLSSCLIGFPLFAATALALIAHQTSRALSNAGQPFARRPSFAAGSLMVIYAAMLGFSAMVGVGIGENVDWSNPQRDTIIWASAVASAVVFQLFATPLMLLPHVLIDRGMPTTVSGALAKGLRAASLVGYGPLAVLGLLLVFLLTLPTVLVDLLEGPGVIVTGICWALAPGLCSAGLATHYAKVRPELVGDPEDPEDSPRALRLVVALAGLLTLAHAVYLFYAMLAPLPMGHAWIQDDPGETQLHLAGGLGLRVVDDGVMVEASDGGGAGFIPSPYEEPILGIDVHPNMPDTVRYDVTVNHEGHRAAAFSINRDGVRTDDDLGRRLDRRIGLLGGFFLGVGALGWFALLFGLRDLAAMRSLRALRSAEDLVGEGDELRLFEGKLTVRDGKLRVRKGRAIADGSVVVSSGELRFRWPSDVWVPLEVMGEELRDGCRLALLGRFASLARAGHREMFVPWPKDARALACDRRGAVGHLASRAARRAALAITPGIIGLLAAAITFLAMAI